MSKDPPHGLPILGPMFRERLYDPYEAPEHTRWIPFNREAAELGACLEACKQVLHLRPLLLEMPSPRTYAMLAAPVLSLVEHTVALHKILGKLGHSKWPAEDLSTFTRTARKLRKFRDGPLRKLRNKLGAHHDTDALQPASGVPAATAGLLLPPLGCSLLYLVMALNHDATFGYYRVPDLSKPREIQVMIEYPVASTILVDEKGLPIVAFKFHIAADPRHESSGIFKDGIDLYNYTAVRAEPRQPVILLGERQDSHSKFDSDSIKLRML